MAQSSYKRATEYAQGIGEGLDKLAGQDVLLTRVSVSERSMRGEPKTFVSMTIAVDPAKPEDRGEYHAWSESLAEKLAAIPDDAFPVLVKFVRAGTAGGFRVWTIE